MRVDFNSEGVNKEKLKNKKSIGWSERFHSKELTDLIPFIRE
jgi:hypothetical protein